MKLSLWIAAVNQEQNYVRTESKKTHGPYVGDAYADVDAEKKNMETAQISMMLYMNIIL